MIASNWINFEREYVLVNMQDISFKFQDISFRRGRDGWLQNSIKVIHLKLYWDVVCFWYKQAGPYKFET